MQFGMAHKSRLFNLCQHYPKYAWTHKINEMVASNDAFLFHWKRTCWVLHMWQQADQKTMSLEPIENYGWAITDNSLTILWGSEENITAIRERVHLLLEGCKCVTGCISNRCGCKRKGKTCYIGCQCLSCSNQDNTSILQQNALAQVAPSEDHDAGRFQDRTECDDIIDWVFADQQEEHNSEIDSESDSDIEDQHYYCMLGNLSGV